jgi:hypothetical protein
MVWLAVWLALFSAMAPSVSCAFHAAANRDAVDLHAVCSSAFTGATPSNAPGAAPTALVWIQGDATPSADSSSQPGAEVAGHCRLCLLSTKRLVTLPSSLASFSIQPATYAVPAAPPPQFVKGFLELNPPSRGPPALS